MSVNVRVKWLLLGLGCVTALAVWLGVAYRATTEWRRTATLLAQRRADTAAESLLTALVHDMHAVEASVLSAPWRTELLSNPTSEVQGIATAFARYPYPEVFFAANQDPTPDSLLFYSRGERTPGWLTHTGRSNLPLMAIGTAPDVAAPILRRIALDVSRRQTFSAFDLDIDEVPYQVVNVSFYQDGYRDTVHSVFGFMVNLAWARSTYFSGLVSQMGHGDEANRGLCFDVRTQDGASVVDGRCGSADAPAASRQFQVTFFNPLLLTVYRPADLVRDTWTLRATVNDDAPLRTATREAQRTLGITALAAIALTSALLLAARAARTETQVANMRSDFAAAVTHELKTPIATIQLISERLASSRNTSIGRSREYGNLSLQQARRLRLLIDNLLAYNRITNVTDAYAFEPMEIAKLVDECIKEFEFQLAEGSFEVVRDVPDDLPVVMADPMAVRLMLSNVIDNAIRYSDKNKFLHVSARAASHSDGVSGSAFARSASADSPEPGRRRLSRTAFVILSVTDHGIGISDKDLAMVTRRFYRGPHSHSGGSGLGLFIAQQLARGHNGALTIRSELGRSTTVEITLPIGGDVA